MTSDQHLRTARLALDLAYSASTPARRIISDEQALIALLTDLMHLCAEKDIDFKECAGIARAHFLLGW